MSNPAIDVNVHLRADMKVRGEVVRTALTTHHVAWLMLGEHLTLFANDAGALHAVADVCCELAEDLESRQVGGAA